jgi:hypothetical protein
VIKDYGGEQDIVQGEELAKQIVDATVKEYPDFFRPAEKTEEVVNESKNFTWVRTEHCWPLDKMYGYEVFNPVSCFEESNIGKSIRKKKEEKEAQRLRREKWELEMKERKEREEKAEKRRLTREKNQRKKEEAEEELQRKRRAQESAAKKKKSMKLEIETKNQ